MIITIDGPMGVGKSSVIEKLAFPNFFSIKIPEDVAKWTEYRSPFFQTDNPINLLDETSIPPFHREFFILESICLCLHDIFEDKQQRPDLVIVERGISAVFNIFVPMELALGKITSEEANRLVTYYSRFIEAYPSDLTIRLTLDKTEAGKRAKAMIPQVRDGFASDIWDAYQTFPAGAQNPSLDKEIHYINVDGKSLEQVTGEVTELILHKWDSTDGNRPHHIPTPSLEELCRGKALFSNGVPTPLSSLSTGTTPTETTRDLTSSEPVPDAMETETETEMETEIQQMMDQVDAEMMPPPPPPPPSPMAPAAAAA